MNISANSLIAPGQTASVASTRRLKSTSARIYLISSRRQRFRGQKSPCTSARLSDALPDPVAVSPRH